MERASTGEHDSGPTDRGVTLVEQLLAMTIAIGVMLSLLAVVGATARAIAAGRQRSVAVSLAKQTLENLQGGHYSNVAMDLTSPGLSSDPLVTGTSPNLSFEGEPVVPGSTSPYRVTITSAGVDFALRTFVTAVAAPSGAGYRRITVLVEWPAASPRHLLRFSSLVFPLDYATYPWSHSTAEATGGQIRLSGLLGGENFDDVSVSLPGASATTNASTLRSSIATATGASSHVDVSVGPVTVVSCPTFLTNPDVGECVRDVNGNVADNDTGSTTGDWSARIGQSFVAGTISTPGGAVVITPAGTSTSRTSTDTCTSCGFGDGDGVPWADAEVTTTTGMSATFQSDHGSGALEGSLWDMASAWSAEVLVDHEAAAGGTAASSAGLAAPGLVVFDLEGAPAGFAGAVLVDPYSVAASAAAGSTLVTPAITGGSTTVHLWDGALGTYRTVTITASSDLDETAAATVAIGDHLVSFVSRVRSQPSTVSVVGSAPRTDAVAQHPAGLVVTVDVVITSASGLIVTDAFSIVVDYGRVSAHAAWLPSSQ